MWKSLCLALALALPGLAAPAAVAASPAKILPVDEAAKDPALAELIAKLLKACDEKDFKPFAEALSPDAIASFGGDAGPKGFRDVYGIGDPDSPFWPEFKAALTLGGAFMEEGLFAAPYTYANWPEDLDSFTYVVAIGAKTDLYVQPKDGAKIVADVTYRILELVETDPEGPNAAPEGWIHVKAGKQDGYVKTAETRSPVDYRAVFQKTANRWWLGAFVGGD
ncbi:MAG: hypothetical protein IT548_07305 [Alphaproteobacteria bacterium]|nr:hypothetical protein [Alphaproteobacteria bacterium]